MFQTTNQSVGNCSFSRNRSHHSCAPFGHQIQGCIHHCWQVARIYLNIVGVSPQKWIDWKKEKQWTSMNQDQNLIVSQNWEHWNYFRVEERNGNGTYSPPVQNVINLEYSWVVSSHKSCWKMALVLDWLLMIVWSATWKSASLIHTSKAGYHINIYQPLHRWKMGWWKHHVWCFEIQICWFCTSPTVLPLSRYNKDS